MHANAKDSHKKVPFAYRKDVLRYKTMFSFTIKDIFRIEKTYRRKFRGCRSSLYHYTELGRGEIDEHCWSNNVG